MKKAKLLVAPEILGAIQYWLPDGVEIVGSAESKRSIALVLSVPDDFPLSMTGYVMLQGTVDRANYKRIAELVSL